MSPSRADTIFSAALTASAAIAGSVLLLVAVYVGLEAWPAFRQVGIPRFLQDPGWFPTRNAFNLIPALVASLGVTSLALLVAAPLGVVSAMFSAFHAPPVAAFWYRRLIELLAGIPSVVYGLWGLVVLVPRIARLGGSGQTLLTAALVLALMILPTVALTADAALRAVPASYLRAAAALGMRPARIAWSVAFPAARAGVVAGIVLATGRALGETVAVLMVAGNVVNIPGGLLEPVRTVTATIALEMGYASRSHQSVLFACGFALVAAVAGLALVSQRPRTRTAGS